MVHKWSISVENIVLKVGLKVAEFSYWSLSRAVVEASNAGNT